MSIQRQPARQAHWTQCALGLLGLLATPACLITNDVDFRVENSPPSLTRIKPPAFTSVPSVSGMDCPHDDGEHVYLQLDVIVADIDVDQTLHARILINGAPADPQNVNRAIGPAPNAAVERKLTPPLCIDTSALTKPCNHVELIVTSDFKADFSQYGTVLPHDDARLEWFVLPGVINAPDLGPSACIAQGPDAGAP